MKVEIFFESEWTHAYGDNINPDWRYNPPKPQWVIWFIDDNWYVRIYAKEEWTCREDAELFAIEEMLK